MGIDKNFLPPVETVPLKLITTGQTIHIRPFLVKEEKILLMGNETTKEALTQLEKHKKESGKDAVVPEHFDSNLTAFIDAAIQVVRDCIVKPKDMDITNLALGDWAYILLNLRKISKGSEIDIRVTCPKDKCGHKEVVTKELEKIIYIENQIQEGKQLDCVVKLGSGFGVELEPTKAQYYKDLWLNMKKESKIDDLVKYDYVAKHIKAVLKKEERIDDLSSEDKKSFIDHLKHDQFEDLFGWFDKLPMAVMYFDHKCKKCNHPFSIRIYETIDFLA